MSRSAVVGIAGLMILSLLSAVLVGSWLAVVFDTFRALT